MIIFQPDKDIFTHSKQYLYPTAVDYFTQGQNKIYLNVGNNIVTPAICYELSNPEHSEQPFKNKANVYIASLLNSVTGVDSDINKLSAIVGKYKMTIFMAN